MSILISRITKEITIIIHILSTIPTAILQIIIAIIPSGNSQLLIRTAEAKEKNRRITLILIKI